MTRFTLSLAATALLLAGCGGGGGSASNSVPDDNTAASESITGKVMDGYIRGATVCLDENGNEECDEGEPTTTSTNGGEYTLVLDEGDDADAPVLAEVGADAIDEDTGEAVGDAYKMQRPPGGGNISPFTTMIQEEMKSNGTTEEAAEATIRSQLGLSANVNLQDDYVAEEATSEEHQVMHEAAKELAGLLQENFAVQGTQDAADGTDGQTAQGGQAAQDGQAAPDGETASGNGPGFSDLLAGVQDQLGQIGQAAKEEVDKETANADDGTGSTDTGGGATDPTGSTDAAGNPTGSTNADGTASDGSTASGSAGTTTDTSTGTTTDEVSFRVPDTGQTSCYDADGNTVTCGSSPSGQDGEYSGNTPSFTANGDGTVTDNVTGLMWAATADLNGDGTIDVSDKKSQTDAVSYCADLTYAGYSDWRLPDIKQMYSLIDFTGEDASNYSGTDTSGLVPFIDTAYFEFGYGDQDADERIIDAQWATTTMYVSTTMNGDETMFGVNLADGRIKGYPTYAFGSDKEFYVYCVRDNTAYGTNSLRDNGDDTVSDAATGLMWEQGDSGEGMDWEAALSHCEEATTAGYSDWRLPDIKELESIVDYTRSPDTTSSAAIDPIFNATSFTNEEGETDWGYYWSSTTHVGYGGDGDSAAYISFGRAMGYFSDNWYDVHGAGAQRSDPKSYPNKLAQQSYTQVTGYDGSTVLSHGPQGDIVRVTNYVRCVRNDDGATAPTTGSENTDAAGVPIGDSGTGLERILYAPMNSTTTYLIDEEGNTLKTWESSYHPGLAAYMLDDGSLLRAGNVNDGQFDAGGTGGVVEKIASDGSTVSWSYEVASDTLRQHHDLEPLPSGNVLMIAWEVKSRSEALAAGRRTSNIDTDAKEVWPDVIYEVNPETSEIVWEWHVWDHLIQDFDSTKENYGVVADHPEKIDVNHVGNGPDTKIDWNHVNGIDYNEELDLIVISSKNFNEGWVIDHGTTTEEAAGEKGDLLYRFGNPDAYGGDGDQQLYGQHDIQWIDNATVILFNNGNTNDRAWSSVDKYTLAHDSAGNYTFTEPTLAWTYTADDLYSNSISGTAVLDNGNILVTEGTDGRLFLINEDGDILWEKEVGASVFKAEHYAE